MDKLWFTNVGPVLLHFCRNLFSKSHLPPAVRPFPLTWLWRIVSPGRSPPGCSKKWFQRLATAGLAAWGHTSNSSEEKRDDAGAAPVTWVEKDPFIRPVNEEALLAKHSNPRGVVSHGPKIHPKLVILNSKTKGLRVTQFSAQTCSCLTNPGSLTDNKSLQQESRFSPATK